MTFTAKTSTEAMAQVREVMGDDAIILATEDDPSGGIRVTAALEGNPPPADPAPRAAPTPRPSAGKPGGRRRTDPPARPTQGAPPATPRPPSPRRRPRPAPERLTALDQLYFAFRDNGVPAPIADYLLALAEGSRAAEPGALLIEVLEREYRFASLVGGPAPIRPVMLIGPPGAGKTQTAAKLAAHAVMHGRRAVLIDTDRGRTGGGARLAAFADALKVPLHPTADGDALDDRLAAVADDEFVIIDSEGCNPLSAADRRTLAELIDGRPVEPVLVLPDGTDPLEATDAGVAFAGLGATRLIVTRTDTSRRHGTPLAAAAGAGLSFADLTRSALIRDGLTPLDPSALADLLLSHTDLPADRLKTGT